MVFLKVCISIVSRSPIANWKYLKKAHITIKSQKTEFDKYATSGVSALSITFINFIQFIKGQNYHDIKNIWLG